MTNTVTLARTMDAREIPWGRGGLAAAAPWPETRPVLSVAISHIPEVLDDDSAALIEHLTQTVVDQATELGAVRLILSGALAEARNLSVELRRVRERHYALLGAQRAERRASRGHNP